MSRLLCVSEKPKWLGFFSGILEAAGYVVVCTTSIPQATLEIGSGTLDIIMTDLGCIAADSLSLVSIARQHEIPVVVISRDIAMVFRPPYADLYLEPPVALKELLAIVNHLLTTRPAAAHAKTQVAVA